MTLPKLKISKHRVIKALPALDQFTSKTADDVTVTLSVRQDKEGTKHYEISTRWQMIGWTTDATKAFEFWHNISLYTAAELFLLTSKQPTKEK